MEQKSQLDPALKAWLDKVIVPVLVREYLTEMRLGKKFASGVEGELESSVKSARSLEGNH